MQAQPAALPSGVMHHSPRLSLSCRAEGDLVLEYALENQGSSPLVVFDGPPGDGTPEPDLTRQVYVAYGPESRVRILRIIPNTPPGLDIARAFIPSVSVVEPGGTRKIRFKMTLPLKERSQYSPDFPGATYEKRTADKVELVLGYVVKNPKTILKPYPSTPSVFQAQGEIGNQQFVSADCPAHVEVIVRTDSKFQRP